jgi:hypothetical protein
MKSARRDLLKKVGLKEDPEDADHQYRHRQAATGRDRQGAEQGSQAADSRRADCKLSEKDSQALLDLLLEFKRRASPRS